MQKQSAKLLVAASRRPSSAKLRQVPVCGYAPSVGKKFFVFDNSPLSVLFRSYYRGRFPSLWEKFDGIVDEGRLLSTREVLNEIKDSSITTLLDWAKNHREIFGTLTAEEGTVVEQIFAVRHFQQNIEQKKLYKGGHNADAFVVAKAAVMNGTVVTLEHHAPNAARIPNICQHFGILWLSREEFMEAEGWEF